MFLPLFDVDLEDRQQGRKISNLLTPLMTSIIVTCILVFLYQITLKIEEVNEFYQKWGTSAYKIINAQRIGPEAYLSLITYSFLHRDIWHLLGNLWFFFIFGNNVERRMGFFMFIIFYFSSAIISALTHMFLFYPKELLGQFSPIQLGTTTSKMYEITTPLIGASGAISAVLGAYLKYFPRNYVVTLVIFIIITTISVPASIFIGIWLLGQITSALLSPHSSIAWFAHIGGFVYGYIFASLYKGIRNYQYQEWQ